jgi:hypothetical protein
MSQKKIILLSSIILGTLLLVGVYSYTDNKTSNAQKYILGTIINIPNENGLEAEMTKIEYKNLKGDIRDAKRHKKLSGEVIAHVNKIMNLSDDGSSFLMPFEVDYEKQEKYTYLGAFYFEPINKSATDNNNSPKIIKHNHSYLIGKNITLEKIGPLIPGSYSFTINIEYFNNKGEQNDLALRFYYEKDAFEVAKNCKDIGSVITRKKSNGENYNVCVFNDNRECTLEAYERGNCPVNGYDISTTDNSIEKWGISHGFLFKNGNFIFPANYENCTIDDFYLERCKIN